MKNSQVFLIVSMTIFTHLAFAQSVPNKNGVFAQALIDGTASAPVPLLSKQLAPVIHALQAKTQDSGPIMIQAKRLFKFQQQSRCGRVIFTITQPSSDTVWPIGGQLNVCEDGLPPWGICKDRPGILVAPTELCLDKSAPQDTPEVAQAIKDALTNGDLSQAQVSQQLKDAAAKKGSAK